MHKAYSQLGARGENLAARLLSYATSTSSGSYLDGPDVYRYVYHRSCAADSDSQHIEPLVYDI